MVTNGEEILKARVIRMYPEDDAFPNEDVNEVSGSCASRNQTIWCDIISYIWWP